MGLALKQDARSSCGLSGVFIGGIPGTEGAEAQSRDLMMDSPLTEADAPLVLAELGDAVELETDFERPRLASPGLDAQGETGDE